MHLGQFLEHWGIAENPFRGEEARHDAVFARVALGGGARAQHSDFDKILGDLRRPSTSIVFGEKGSGKTALRMQIAARVAAHNEANPTQRVLLLPHDDLNAVLDRFRERVGGEDGAATLASFRLVDHIDALLLWAVPRLVDAALGARAADGSASGAGGRAIDLGPEPRRALRRLDASLGRDLLVLQAVYDRPESADVRSPALRRALGLSRGRGRLAWKALAAIGWFLPALALAGWWQTSLPAAVWAVLAGAGGLLWVAALARTLVLEPMSLRRIGRRLRRRVRVSPRGERSYAASLAHLDPIALGAGSPLPTTDADDARYAMLDRLRRVLGAFGYAGVLVVIDRVDEPSLISGNPDAMRALVWPLLSNKFLQMEGLGVKMLLPIELRHALYRESSAFFQEARLDKQNLVDRLGWTGATLYDLCEARLAACAADDATPPALIDLFADDVTTTDLVDALDQMHQPRDAFKFLYQCLSEHCANVTAEQQQWRIPRLVLEQVRRRQAERVQQLYRGISPA